MNAFRNTLIIGKFVRREEIGPFSPGRYKTPDMLNVR